MPKTKEVVGEVAGNLKSGSVRRVALTIVGMLLFVVGAVGSFIPIFPGRTTMAAGLVLLSVHSPTLHAWVKRKTQKYPRLQSSADRTRNWLIRRLHR